VPSFTLVNAALAGSEGAATFHQLRNAGGSSLLTPRTEIRREFLDNSWDVVGTPQVRTITYDNLVAKEEEVSILKLDIQAGEMDMLTASQAGLKKTKCIIMEVTFTSHYEGDAGFPELHNLLASKGFGLYRLSAPYDRGARVLFSDAVYLQEEILSKMIPDR
jgi:FkbM family methyltransferase